MDVPDHFKELDLYEVLNISSKSTENEIRKAYLKRALRTHPDKGGDEEEFQKVAFSYSILSDPERKKQYDETGSLDFGFDAKIRDLFSKSYKVEITEEMINEDKLKYQKSDEEKQDVIDSYLKYNGDFDLIFESIVHSTVDDISRLVKLIKGEIKAGTLQETQKFKKTTTKRHINSKYKEAKEEEIEAAENAKKLGVETESDLAALIKKRRAGGLDDLIGRLEEKYAPKKKSKSKK